MKRLWHYKNKLALQLGLCIIIVNVLVLTVSFTLQYHKIEETMLSNYSSNSVEWFLQLKYNIADFYNQMDAVLLDLAQDKNIAALSKLKSIQAGKKYPLLYSVIDVMSMAVRKDPGIRACSYYSQDGVEVEYYEKNGQYHLYDYLEEKGNYFASLFKIEEANPLKLRWVGGYDEETLGFPYEKTAVKKDPDHFISIYRGLMDRKGIVALQYDMFTFLNKFLVGKDGKNEKVYILDEKNRIIAAEDTAMILTERVFQNGELVGDGVFRYRQNSEEGEIQVVTYSLPFMNWQVVIEKPVSEVMADLVAVRDTMMIVCVAGAALLLVLVLWLLALFLQPIGKLAVQMQKVGEGELGNTLDKIPNNEIGVLVSRFNEMSLKLVRMFEKNQQMEEERINIEMQSLRAQINPHLIYNTLNTIKWMAVIRKEQGIAESIALLSSFLRPVFRNNAPLCSIKEELDYVEKYIAIMNLRNTNKIELEINVPETYFNYQIIRFLLQPVVENSVLHGFEQRDSGAIRISMAEEAGDGIILIEDNGSGMVPEKLQILQERLQKREIHDSGGVGILNVNKRVYLQYGDGYGLSIQNKVPSGICVTVRIRLVPHEPQQLRVDTEN